MKKFLASIVLVVFLFFLFLFWGGKYFTKYSVNSKIESLRDSIDFSSKELFTHTQLNEQPELIKKFFTSVITDSIYSPKFITLNISGKFKTDVNSEWMPLESTEYFTTDRINFLWNAVINNSKFFWVYAIDSYLNGKGNMLIKINSSVTIADSWGIELDKSGLFRYFSEAVFFPTSLLPNKNITWNIIDTNVAEIKFSDNDISVVAKFYFNENGTVHKIETFDKFRSMNADYKESLYTVYYTDYKYFNNTFLIPTKYEVEWDLPTGKFKYGKFKVENVHYE